MINFQLNFNTPTYHRNVYLSCSWRADEGKSASWVVVRDLDQNKVRAIGDIIGESTQDPLRIRRIMDGTDGFVCVLPYRDNKFTTSEYILQELSIAIDKEMLIALFYDDRVQVSVKEEKDTVEITLPCLEESTLSIIRPLKHQKIKFFGPIPFTYGIGNSVEDQLRVKLTNFLETLRSLPRVTEPYALVFSRLDKDFAHAREAIRSAVEIHAGVPCVWVNDSTELFSSNLTNNVRQLTRELLRHASFVVVDISRSAQTPYSENPTLAFELGQTDFASKKFFLSMRRIPNYQAYFAVADFQWIPWEDERELHQHLSNWIQNNRTEFSRNIYNRSKELLVNSYHPVVVDYKEFVYNSKLNYKLHTLTSTERMLIAASISLIILSVTQLVNIIFGFENGYDLLSVIASIIALFFGSFYISIQTFFAQNRIARLTVYILAISLFLAFVFAFAATS
ncbi:MAG: hypothetical protein OHK0046_12770 [Anaerolineae bacterium]